MCSIRGQNAIIVLAVSVISLVGCRRDAAYYEGRILRAGSDLHRALTAENAQQVLEWCRRMEACSETPEEKDRARVHRIVALSDFCFLYGKEMQRAYDDVQTSAGKSAAAFEMGLCLLASGQLERGLDWLDKYLKLPGPKKPSDVSACYLKIGQGYATIASLTGDARWYEEMLKYYDKALSADPSWRTKAPRIFEIAVEMYEQSGSPGQGSQYWRRKLGVEPHGSPEAKP
jgi:tetratricopeptide (TPR) repeat protein